MEWREVFIVPNAEPSILLPKGRTWWQPICELGQLHWTHSLLGLFGRVKEVYVCILQSGLT